MKQLKIKILAKVYVIFSRVTVQFIRGEQTTKEITLPYSNATGQTLSAGQVLYTTGTIGQLGYLEVKCITNTTLANAGNFNISITNYPTSTEANKTILFNIDNSPVNLDIYYNSNPITNDIVVQTSNRVVYTFKSQDFLTNITDYDNDQIDSISLVGDLTGFSLNNSPISSGSWISIVDISAEKLKYTPLNQDGYYEKNIQYQAKDINGNISIP